MGTFTGQLNVNHIQSALFNMIISQDILGGKIKNNYNLVDKAKEEAGLYGDTKLYIDSPTLTPVDWVQDSEDATNLLALDRPGAPKTQKLTIDIFKQVRLTKDNYLSKQAFGTAGAFVAYQSVLESRLSKTKEVYLNKTYNTFIGTCNGGATINELEINTKADDNSAGENIAYSMANLIDDMKDYSNDYTKNGFERAFGDEDIIIVWNNKYVNAVKKIDLPSVFHDEKLEASFVGDVLPSRYFGTVITADNVSDFSASTPAAGKPIDSDTGAYTPGSNHANGIIRAAKDLYKPFGTAGATVYIAAGTEIPASKTIGASATDFLYGEVYIEQPKIICKVFTKLPPMLEAFSVGTDFFNAKNLSTNMYLTFGHSTLETLDSEACITVYDTAE